jgi:hypothetical protein
MLRLALIVYGMAGPTLAGILIVAALVAGLDTLRPIMIAAAAGFAAALPVAWAVARRLDPRG